MRHGFDTQDDAAAVAALLVYACWRSRDAGALRITPDIWSQVERFVRAAAKRAPNLPRFIEALRPRLGCGALEPRHLRSDAPREAAMLVERDAATGAVRQLIEAGGERRAFLTEIMGGADHPAVLARLYRETGWVVLLVRDRLEREKPYEAMVGRGGTVEAVEVAA